MPANAVAENVLGTIGTVLWSFQLVPQIIKSYRAKDTDGLSAYLLLIWVAGSIPQGTYLVVQNINIPLIIQPQLFSTFAIIAMAQCWRYIGIVVLELGIFACYLLLNPKAARRRLREQETSPEEMQSNPATALPASAGREADLEQANDSPSTAVNTPDWSRHTTLEEKSKPIDSTAQPINSNTAIPE
ncbi:hypothetical protein PHSY_002263 [Pseudozyma hubeiensis SY62]|uniref:PQ loop repeat protein n=1 Tax=Pseudozyma hubeiensis (strain SY62) TaxID=1305764 RepID=R9P9B8_PSEHS|nr:hypothetical protein PHSY_002263 [Pseudozyma hubeiensis SY62]GAC94690.1 hypothetical protein PHSY_002263 [Pseudozyma hubeiensis SY62]